MVSGAFPHQLEVEFLAALQGLIGRHALERVMRVATLDGTDTLARLAAALEDLYGLAEGQELMRHAGRRVLQPLWEGWVGGRIVLRLQDLLPATVALHWDLLILSEMFNRYRASSVRLEHLSTGYLWRMTACPFCQGRHGTRTLCGGMQGVLEGLLRIAHATSFEVHERACMALGHSACEFELKSSLDCKVQSGENPV